MTGGGGALHAEWTKLRTVPGTAWLVLGSVAATVVVSSAAVASVDIDHCAPGGCLEDTTRLSLAGVWLGQVPIVVLAALAMTNEYGTGMIGTTLAAAPGRGAVLLAKAAVVTGVALVAGVLAVLGSLLAGRLLLPRGGFTTAAGYPPPTLADGPTMRAAAGTVLYLALIALLSLGLATIVRGTAPAITGVLTLLYLVPVVTAFVADPQWQQRLHRAAPMTAGLAIQATTGLDRLPIGPWAGLGVLAAYAGAALLAATVLFTIRDA